MAALLSDKLPFWPDMSSTELAYLHIQDLLGVQHTYRIKKIGRERDCNNKDRKIKQKDEERQKEIITSKIEGEKYEDRKERLKQ
jgi:hypothetical protein